MVGRNVFFNTLFWILLFQAFTTQRALADPAIEMLASQELRNTSPSGSPIEADQVASDISLDPYSNSCDASPVLVDLNDPSEEDSIDPIQSEQFVTSQPSEGSTAEDFVSSTPATQPAAISECALRLTWVPESAPLGAPESLLRITKILPGILKVRTCGAVRDLKLGDFTEGMTTKITAFRFHIKIWYGDPIPLNPPAQTTAFKLLDRTELMPSDAPFKFLDPNNGILRFEGKLVTNMTLDMIGQQNGSRCVGPYTFGGLRVTL